MVLERQSYDEGVFTLHFALNVVGVALGEVDREFYYIAWAHLVVEVDFQGAQSLLVCNLQAYGIHSPHGVHHVVDVTVHIHIGVGGGVGGGAE